MIKLRHQQPSLWHRGLAEDIEGLWEPWMLLVDKLLEDEQLLDRVYEAGTAGGEKPKTVPFGIEATSQPVSSFEHADSTLRPGSPLLPSAKPALVLKKFPFATLGVLVGHRHPLDPERLSRLLVLARIKSRIGGHHARDSSQSLLVHLDRGQQ